MEKLIAKSEARSSVFAFEGIEVLLEHLEQEGFL